MNCPDCKAVWLDKGEFEKIIQKLDEEANSKSVPEYVRESIKEAGEIVSGPESFLSEWKDFTTVLRMLEYRLLAEHKKLFDSVLNLQKLNPFR